MFGKKTRELQEQLTQRNTEIEQLKKRIEELEANVAQYKEQEELVVKAITEANRTANRIEQEANDKKDELVAKAEDTVREAEEKAGEMMNKADEDAKNVRKAADDYSENVRTDANIYVERTIFASQSEVRKREDVVSEMNEFLKKTTAYLNEQTETFTALLKSVIDDNEKQTKEICKEVNKCNCSCKDCANPCENKKDADDEDEDDSDGESAEPETISEDVSEPEPSDDPAQEDTAAKLSEVDPKSLPDEYKTPAELMQNIYYIQHRELPDLSNVPRSVNNRTIPDNVTDIRDLTDRTPDGGLAFKDELTVESEMPHDEQLGELVSEVVPAS